MQQQAQLKRQEEGELLVIFPNGNWSCRIFLCVSGHAIFMILDSSEPDLSAMSQTNTYSAKTACHGFSFFTNWGLRAGDNIYIWLRYIFIGKHRHVLESFIAWQLVGVGRFSQWQRSNVSVWEADHFLSLYKVKSISGRHLTHVTSSTPKGDNRMSSLFHLL